MNTEMATSENSTVTMFSATKSDASRTASALVIAAGDKAGMEGIDRAKIDEIILRESGDSAYMKQQRKRDENVNKRIELMRLKLREQDGAGANWRETMEGELAPKMQGHISNRSSRSTCVVVDMDMFYMACELLTRPHLRDKPACVGHGMITTSNYVARRYGVRAAMAGWIGDKLVEELSGGKERLIHVPSDFDLYKQKSKAVREVLSQFDPNMKAYSLDEAYLDIGDYVALYLKGKSHDDISRLLRSEAEKRDQSEGDCLESSTDDDDENSSAIHPLASIPQEVALQASSQVVADMRRRVHEATQLTCSAGLAPNFMLAKIASDANKPNGQMVVGPAHADVVGFLYPMQIRKVGGIGRVTEKMLNAFEIRTVQDLYDHRALVAFLFQPATAGFLLRASLGCSSSRETNDFGATGAQQKGISCSRTFRSGEPWCQLCIRLEAIARKLATDMARKQLKAHTITVTVKLHTFDVMTKSLSMPRGVYIHEADDLVRHSNEIFQSLRKEFKGNYFSVRLLGVRCSNFQSEAEKEDTSQTKMEQFLKGEDDATSDQSDQIVPMKRSSTTAKRGNGRKRQKGTVDLTKTVVGSSSRQISCPVCGKKFDERHNSTLNTHLDSCLNGVTVRRVVQQESQLAPTMSKARLPKRKLTDFFGAS